MLEPIGSGVCPCAGMTSCVRSFGPPGSTSANKVKCGPETNKGAETQRHRAPGGGARAAHEVEEL